MASARQARHTEAIKNGARIRSKLMRTCFRTTRGSVAQTCSSRRKITSKMSSGRRGTWHGGDSTWLMVAGSRLRCNVHREDCWVVLSGDSVSQVPSECSKVSHPTNFVFRAAGVSVLSRASILVGIERLETGCGGVVRSQAVRWTVAGTAHDQLIMQKMGRNYTEDGSLDPEDQTLHRRNNRTRVRTVQRQT